MKPALNQGDKVKGILFFITKWVQYPAAPYVPVWYTHCLMSKTMVLLPWQQLSEQGSQPAICRDCRWHNVRLSDSECKPFTTGNYHCHSVLRGLFSHFDSSIALEY
jgi:hypothetical protein